MRDDSVIHKARQPGITTFAELLKIEADAAPKLDTGKFRLALCIRAANKGFRP